MEYIVNDLTKWKIMPLSAVRIIFENDSYLFNNLEESSTFVFAPVLRPDSFGGFRTVAYELKSTIYIIENNIGERISLLDSISRLKIQGVELIFKSNTEQINGAELYLGDDDQNGANKDWHCYWTLLTKDSNLCLKLEINAMLSIDIINNNQASEFIKTSP